AMVALTAFGLSLVSSGWIRISWGAFAVGLLALITRSLRRCVLRADSPLESIPSSTGQIYLGQAFEWTLDAVQETLERGRPARRTEQPLFLPDWLLNQHLLVLGTTGVGKTRLLELLALQAVARGDAVILIDPKG